MALSRTEVVEGFTQEIAGFDQLLRSLTDEQWAAPTRCEGWTVADVAAHVTGNLVAVTSGAFEEFSDPDHAQRQVAERRGRGRDAVADELYDAAIVGEKLLSGFDDASWQLPAPGGVDGTVGDGVVVLWYDAYVHADDIRVAAGLPSERGPGVAAAVHGVARVLAEQGWGPATLALDEVDEVELGGGGRRITGDPLQFVLAATGRIDASAVGLDETVNIYR